MLLLFLENLSEHAIVAKKMKQCINTEKIKHIQYVRCLKLESQCIGRGNNHHPDQFPIAFDIPQQRKRVTRTRIDQRLLKQNKREKNSDTYMYSFVTRFRTRGTFNNKL